MDPRARDIAVSLLAWQREMGADVAIDDLPVHWLERGDEAPGAAVRAAILGAVEPVGAPLSVVPGPAAAAPAAPSPRPAPGAVQRPPPAATTATAMQPQRAFAAKPPDAAETSARAAAAAAQSLAELEAAIRAFDGCGLKATATSTCVYRGAERARVMVIGEAPGRDEDLAGKPFVGRAGQMLDKMLATIGLEEKDVHVTNIVYWRPPGNRTPTLHEAQVCRPFLVRQAELVAPEIVMLMGGSAANHVLDVAEGIMKLRGRWRDITFGSHKARAMACLHPAYLLRTPAAKRMAWLDLLAIRAALTGG